MEMKTYLKIIVTILCVVISISLNSCHPCYKRLTKGNWHKDTTWVKFPVLPEPVKTAISKYANAEATIDTLDDMEPLISLDSLRKAENGFFADAYSQKIIIPFGWYFKIGKNKYFMHYAYAYSPIIYFQNCLYFDARRYYDNSYDTFVFSKNERIPYEKRFFVKYVLKGRKRAR